MQRLEIELAAERVEILHELADRAEPVNLGVGRLGRPGAHEQRRVGRTHHGRGVVGPGQQMQMKGEIVEELQRQRDVADQYPERRRNAADGHLDGHGRGHGMHPAAHAARAARDEDGVARIASDHDDLVAAEQRRHRPRLEHLAPLEVGHGVEGQRAGDPRDRVEVHALDVAVPRNELLDLVARDLPGFVGERVRVLGRQKRLAPGVELDRQVTETHDLPRPRSPLPRARPSRDGAPVPT